MEWMWGIWMICSGECMCNDSKLITFVHNPIGYIGCPFIGDIAQKELQRIILQISQINYTLDAIVPKADMP